MSGGVGFEFQFFVKDIGLSFPTNLLISDRLKIVLFEAEDEESKSMFSSKIVSFPFLEMARVVLVEVPCSVFPERF